MTMDERMARLVLDVAKNHTQSTYIVPGDLLRHLLECHARAEKQKPKDELGREELFDHGVGVS